MRVTVRIYLNHELIRQETLSLDCMVLASLLGIDISKDARYPTELRVEIEEAKES